MTKSDPWSLRGIHGFLGTGHKWSRVTYLIVHMPNAFLLKPSLISSFGLTCALTLTLAMFRRLNSLSSDSQAEVRRLKSKERAEAPVKLRDSEQCVKRWRRFMLHVKMVFELSLQWERCLRTQWLLAQGHREYDHKKCEANLVALCGIQVAMASKRMTDEAQSAAPTAVDPERETRGTRLCQGWILGDRLEDSKSTKLRTKTPEECPHPDHEMIFQGNGSTTSFRCNCCLARFERLPMKEEHTRVQRQTGETKMMFGRYRDRSYTEVLSVDPNYCEWCKMITMKKQEEGAQTCLEMARFVRWLDRYHVVSRQAQRSGQQNVSVESDWELIYRQSEEAAETVMKNQQTVLDQLNEQIVARAAVLGARGGVGSNDVPMTGVRPIMLSPKNSKKVRGDGQLPGLPEGEGDDL